MNIKKTILVMVAAVFAVSVTAQTNFRHLTLKEALATAKQEKKLVFVDFYTDWCGPCKKMANEVFPQKKLGDFMNSKFVCIKLNAEKEGLDDAKHYGVNAYPTFYVLDTEGKLMVEVKGSMDADAFMAKINGGLDPKLSIEAMGERYKKGERDPQLVNLWALHHMQKGDETTGFAIVKEYYESLKEKDLLKAENAFLFTRYTMSVDEPMGKFMVEHRNQFDKAVSNDILDRISKLYRREVINYYSGHFWKENKYVESEYQALKAKICELGLDKNYPYQPMFTLIESRVSTTDDAVFFGKCKEVYDQLNPDDQTLLVLNFTRLIPSNDPAIKKDMSQFIRSRLATMSTNTISLCGRLLESIEK